MNTYSTASSSLPIGNLRWDGYPQYMWLCSSWYVIMSLRHSVCAKWRIDQSMPKLGNRLYLAIRSIVVVTIAIRIDVSMMNIGGFSVPIKVESCDCYWHTQHTHCHDPPIKHAILLEHKNHPTAKYLKAETSKHCIQPNHYLAWRINDFPSHARFALFAEVAIPTITHSTIYIIRQ